MEKFCALCGVLFLGVGATMSGKKTPVKLIIDTDIGGGGCNDVDDVVAVCMANALMDNGEAEILGIIQNTAPVECAGAISVLTHYYGRDSKYDIAAYNISTPGASLEVQSPLPYVTDLVSNWPSPIKNSTQVPDAVATYRKILASQPARSVAISSIGIHTNLAGLLKSEGDSYSDLNGIDLVREKVYLLAVMGGAYPHGYECNLMGGGSNKHNHEVAAAASSYVAAHWPPESKLIWSGFEVGFRVQTGGARFQKCKAATPANPCRGAMVNYEGGPNKSRYSWDPLTTLVAVRGPAAASTSECKNCDGHNVVDPKTGGNTWVSGPKTNQTYLVLHDPEAAGEAIDALLCQEPLARS